MFPIEVFTLSIFVCTAFSDSSITSASAITSARIATIDTVRMLLRNAFLVPRPTTLIEDAVSGSPL